MIRVNWTIWRAHTFGPVAMPLVDESGAARDLAGYTFRLAAKDKVTGDVAFDYSVADGSEEPDGPLTMDAETGIVTFGLAWDETQALQIGRFSVELQEISSDDVRLAAASGIVWIRDREIGD